MANMSTPEEDEVGPFQRFVLQRDTDVSGVSGTGVVAEGVLFSNGVVALQWTSEFPTSVVFHQRGMESVRAVHGHGGATRIVWLDSTYVPPAEWPQEAWSVLIGRNLDERVEVGEKWVLFRRGKG